MRIIVKRNCGHGPIATHISRLRQKLSGLPLGHGRYVRMIGYGRLVTDQWPPPARQLAASFEVDIAFQDVPELGIGRGIEKLELGSRLHYHLHRQFAPYFGVHWERKLGRTANFARADGEKVSAVSFVFGIRTWF